MIFCMILHNKFGMINRDGYTYMIYDIEYFPPLRNSKTVFWTIEIWLICHLDRHKSFTVYPRKFKKHKDAVITNEDTLKDSAPTIKNYLNAINQKKLGM